MNMSLTYIMKVATRFPVFSLNTGLEGDWLHENAGIKNLMAAHYKYRKIFSN